MKPPEQQPSEIPIDQAIKNVLLAKRQIPDWLGNMFTDVSLKLTGNYPTEPMKEKAVYETVWYFDKMTPEQIKALDKNALGSILSKLETEQQDDLVKRLPETLENEFWELVEQNDQIDQ